MQKINIFHLSPFPYYSGGICTWLNNLLISIDGKYDVTIYCPHPNKEQLAVGPIHNVAHLSTVRIEYIDQFKTYPSMAWWAIKVFFHLFFKINRDAKTIVLSTIPTMFPIILLRFFGRIKGEVICSVRGQLSRDAVEMNKGGVFQKVIKIFEGLCLRSADRLIANGWDTQDFLQEYFGLESEVIPNGYMEKNHNQTAIDEGVSLVQNLKEQGKIIISHVGTVRKVKCIDHILEAISLLTPEERSKSAFIFIGKGMIEHYRKVANDLGVEVLFLGEKKYVLPYYEMSDYVINVSGGSGVSNSLIETLFAGRPVIVWDNKTFTQVIEDGVNGIYCEHKSVNSMVRGFKQAINQEIVFDEDKIKASAMDFQWDKVVTKWHQKLEN